MKEFSELLGKTLTKVENKDDEIIFTLENGEKYKLYHAQDCCETVYVEDICGDLEDLVGSSLLQAEEATNDTDVPVGRYDYLPECFLWTFYKLATIKGYVTIRWYGESNGYYSMGVSFGKMNEYGGIEY